MKRIVAVLILAALMVVAAQPKHAVAYTNGGWTWYPAGNFGWRDVSAWIGAGAHEIWNDIVDPEVQNKSAWRSVGTRSAQKPVQPKAEVTEQD